MIDDEASTPPFATSRAIRAAVAAPDARRLGRDDPPAMDPRARDRIAATIAERFGLRAPARGSACALETIAEERRRALGLASLDHYAARVAHDEDERWALAARVSNGWTWFFRDREPLAALVDRLATRGGPRAIWVAGGSTGEEAYGLAMLAAARGLDVELLATDLDEARLEVGRRAIYGAHAMRQMSPEERARWLVPAGPDAWRVREDLRRRVTFRRHNLMDAPPAIARFDAVVCRNVFIHAVDAGAAQMSVGLTRALAPGGEVLLGASDLLPSASRGSSPPPRPSTPPPSASTPPPPSPEPVDAIALITMGNLFVEARSFDRAEAAYRRAEGLDPCSAELYVAWGVLHRKRGAFEHAAVALRRAVFLDETLWPAWALLAGALARLGAHRESELARREARRARRERPAPRWRSRLDRLLPIDDLRLAAAPEGG